MTKNIIFTFSLVVLFLGFCSFVEGAELKLNYSPPCPFPGDALGECLPQNVGTDNLANYIRRVYQFAVAVSGVLALGMIVLGGIYISVSAGSPDKQKEGKSMIVSAIWGVVLILGSYLILRTINPRLVELPIPEIQKLTNVGKYQLAKFTCPTESQTGCFFDDDGALCDFEDPDEVCNAIEKASPACSGGGPDCACKNCQLLETDDYATKANSCSGGITSSTLGKCMLEEKTLDSFKDFYGNLDYVDVPLGTDSNKWKVVEAFPPTSPHASKSHYNGRAFDIARALPSTNNPEFCGELRKVVSIARTYFWVVNIESLPNNFCEDLSNNNLPNGVSRRNFDTSNIFHVHIESSKN